MTHASGVLSGRIAGPVEGGTDRNVGRRRALLDAARALFMQKGFRKTTINEIIEAAGGSKETLYKEFGGKLGLFATIIAEIGEDVARSIDKSFAAHLPPRGGLTHFGSQLMAVWCSPLGRVMNRLVACEGLDSPELMDAWYRGGTQPFIAALARFLEEQARAGLLQIDDPVLAAKQFQMVLMGEAMFPIMARSKELLDPSAAVERAVTLMLRAYSTPKAGP